MSKHIAIIPLPPVGEADYFAHFPQRVSDDMALSIPTYRAPVHYIVFGILPRDWAWHPYVRPVHCIVAVIHDRQSPRISPYKRTEIAYQPFYSCDVF